MIVSMNSDEQVLRFSAAMLVLFEFTEVLEDRYSDSKAYFEEAMRLPLGADLRLCMLPTFSRDDRHTGLDKGHKDLLEPKRPQQPQKTHDELFARALQHPQT
jgi:hypothetical protein